MSYINILLVYRNVYKYIPISGFIFFVQLNVEQEKKSKVLCSFMVKLFAFASKAKEAFICNAFNKCKKMFNYVFIIFFFVYLVASYMPSVPDQISFSSSSSSSSHFFFFVASDFFFFCTLHVQHTLSQTKKKK